jgi:hypothetical protein
MIAKARCVSYGGNALRYSTKKEDAEIVKIHNLPEGLSATTLWAMMHATQQKFREKLNRHRHLEKTAIKIEVSPSEEETAGWTLEDWVKLADDFIRAFDAVDLSGKAKRSSAKSTNLRNSQYVVMLHHDSQSGILHLHITASRLDMDGKINDDHCIHERAMRAANQVTKDRNWVQAKTIQEANIRQIYKDCISILDQMDSSFSWERYEQNIRSLGYGIEFRRDSNDQITGYTILKGNSRYKSSILGSSRDLTPTRILDTWKELHPGRSESQKPNSQPETPQVVAPKRTKLPQPKPEEKKPVKPIPAKILQKITVGYKEYPVEIPETVFNFFKENADVPEDTLWTKQEHILQTSMLLFAGFVDGATTIADNCGGAGSSATDDWGKKKPDEDDMAFAKRCLERARQLHTRPPRRGMHM